MKMIHLIAMPYNVPFSDDRRFRHWFQKICDVIRNLLLSAKHIRMALLCLSLSVTESQPSSLIMSADG